MSLELEREEVVQALCTHYAQDHLTTGELESRFERVYAAKDRDALRTVLEGLPAVSRSLVAAPISPPLYQPPAPSGAVRESEKRLLAMFSTVRKEGAWRPPRVLRGRVWFGELVLDFREADIPPEGVLIDVEVYFGEARILLPLGVGADVDCSAILGEAVDKTQPGNPGLPMIKVEGGATFGTVKVETKLPKPQKLESWRDQVKGWLGV